MLGIEAARRAQLVERGFEYGKASKLVFLKWLVEQGRIGDLRPLSREFVLFPEPSPITKPVPNPTPTELGRMTFFQKMFKNRSPELSARIIVNVNNVNETIAAAETKLAASYPTEEPKTTDEPKRTPREQFARWLFEKGKITEQIK